MSKWPMRGHFRYFHFKTFPMTPRTPQCEVFWALLLNSKHSKVPKDSKSPTLEVLGFTPTLGQSGVVTTPLYPFKVLQTKDCASILYSFVVFSLDSHLSPSRNWECIIFTMSIIPIYKGVHLVSNNFIQKR